MIKKFLCIRKKSQKAIISFFTVKRKERKGITCEIRA